MLTEIASTEMAHVQFPPATAMMHDTISSVLSWEEMEVHQH